MGAPLSRALYSWAAACRREGVPAPSLPWAIRAILRWIRSKLEAGRRLERPFAMPKGPRQELFRTDARAEDGRAWVGGWEVGPSTRQSRWFAEELTKDWTPWAWAKANDPNRTIAALELFGTILAMKLFKKPGRRHTKGVAVVTGSTDNQGNAYAVQKAMSTKFPLTILLMELSEEMREQQVVLDLNWKPREMDQEADDLSNMKTGDFSPEHRLRAGPDTISFLVLDELMTASSRLYEQIVREKENRAGRRAPPSGAPASKKHKVLAAW